MDIKQFDLNLLVCFDALMREKNVSRAAEQLDISQPAMSNSLKRLRHLLKDPLLVRTTQGMQPTEQALTLELPIRNALNQIQSVLSSKDHFTPASSQRIFRILASDYIESTLIVSLASYLQQYAPGITLDILTLSDASFQDLEKGNIDIAINRFDDIPLSFHQRLVWKDSFSCLMNAQHPLMGNHTLEEYLTSGHIWISKTGIGVATGMSQNSSNKRSWVDNALATLHCERDIRVFTRHHQMVPLLVNRTDLIATLPTRAAELYRRHDNLVMIKPPFKINPIEVKMVWSPLSHHNSAHQWLRRTLVHLANDKHLNRHDDE